MEVVITKQYTKTSFFSPERDANFPRPLRMARTPLAPTYPSWSSLYCMYLSTVSKRSSGYASGLTQQWSRYLVWLAAGWWHLFPRSAVTIPCSVFPWRYVNIVVCSRENDCIKLLIALQYINYITQEIS